jgi:hypothetical protein
MLTLRANRRSLPFRISHPDGRSRLIDRADLPREPWEWAQVKVDGRLAGFMMAEASIGTPSLAARRTLAVRFDLGHGWSVAPADAEKGGTPC